MKIIHEFYGKQPQATGTVVAYGRRVDQPPAWNGSRCEVMVTDCIDWEDPDKRREGDALYIEGDTDAVRAALKAALNVIDLMENYARDSGAIINAREVECPLCRGWHDPKASSHGDGHGNACYGLLEERKRLVLAETPDDMDR